MRFARAVIGANETAFGVVADRDGGATFSVLEGDPVRDRTPTSTNRELPLASVRLLAPVVSPGKIVGFGKNFTGEPRIASWREGAPVTFLKPATAVVGPDDAIVVPRDAHVVEPEVELAVVIGRRTHKIDADSALDQVFGYALANDVTARDYMSDGHWTRAKGIDTFCPIGPWIETDVDPNAVLLTTLVNGSAVQAGSTSELVMDAASLIAYAADHFTLEPGDIILTGSPPGRVSLSPGDIVEAVGDGIGTLRNRVVAERPHRRRTER